MADIIEGVSPTRMELLDINKKIKLARKGHKLLKEKRDSLVTEFFGVIDKAKGARADLAETMNRAYPDLIKAEALTGKATVESIAATSPGKGSLKISTKNIMGVHIPSIAVEETQAGKFEKTPGTVHASTKLNEASEKFDKAYMEAIKLAETEETIRRLGDEIKKTKRRVNSLEYIMIPRLDNTKKYITARLEEMERESFFRLKMVKRKKQRAVQ
ncbi:MAG: V-type ATP synthase subunit D [Candidatus Altiarchaeota archaeon]|nr:V-type ATP synthase subunit D [Candidatus Altiarchaeota archaeon]